MNKAFDKLNTLFQLEKDKVEFLCNECCWADAGTEKLAMKRSAARIWVKTAWHYCKAPEGERGILFFKSYRESRFIGINDIRDIYLPMGFSNFKIEGKRTCSALILEFLLYYMTKPEYQIHVRENLSGQYAGSVLEIYTTALCYYMTMRWFFCLKKYVDTRTCCRSSEVIKIIRKQLT